MRAHEVAPGVWVTARRDTGATWPHPDDSAAAGMAGWRAREFLAGRALLRTLLAEVLPDAARARVVPGHNGKPYLPQWPLVGISVAHDGGAVAAAVARDRPVGVDVQLPPDRLADAVIRRCLRGYAGQLTALPPDDRAREFAWVWTAQEACVKAAGTGLSGSPWAIDVPPRRTGGTWHDYRWISLRDLSDTPLSCAWKETP
ncbi:MULTISPECIES: 4'-phosphopantetheinyl transferase family protein [unclassified Micromonospora]|uniref:4'-phosphopantetheinyl transferase family protein n=1 Tax=unclassified Micromonospora TaxID=2617518 RepID=UPI003629D6A0